MYLHKEITYINIYIPTRTYEFTTISIFAFFLVTDSFTSTISQYRLCHSRITIRYSRVHSIVAVEMSSSLATSSVSATHTDHLGVNRSCRRLTSRRQHTQTRRHCARRRYSLSLASLNLCPPAPTQYNLVPIAPSSIPPNIAPSTYYDWP